MNLLNLLILCAGKGERLGQDLPKALVQINGHSIIANLIKSFEVYTPDNLTKMVYIVTGYKHELLEEEISQIEHRDDIILHTVYNSNFESGILSSVLVGAKSIIDKGFCLAPTLRMDGDILIKSFIPIRQKEDIIIYKGLSKLWQIDKYTVINWAKMELYYNVYILADIATKYSNYGHYYQALSAYMRRQAPITATEEIDKIYEFNTPKELEDARRRYSEES